MRRSDAFLTNMAAAVVALSIGRTTRAQAMQQDAAKTIAMCAGISSDLQRLSCYDDLSRQVRSSDTAQNKSSSPPENSAASSAAMAPAATAAGSHTNSEDRGGLGGWVRNDQVDGLDNSKIIVLSHVYGQIPQRGLNSDGRSKTAARRID